MRKVIVIRRFEYRPSRTKAGFTVDFVVDGQTFHGLSGDISDAGIRAEIDGSTVPVPGSSGLLILRHPAGTLKLEARVAYVEKHQVGLVFIFQSPWERGITIKFIASIASHSETSLSLRFL